MYTLDDDRLENDAPIEGYRPGLAAALIAHCPTGGVRERITTGSKRFGYQQALCVLRAWSQAPAYPRSEPIAQLQREIDRAIVQLEQHEELLRQADGKRG
jgi:hypothetical protein